MISLRAWLKPKVQDWVMGSMNKLRPDTVAHAQGEVLEIGFGTGLNVAYYGQGVRRVCGVDPLATAGVSYVKRRIEEAPFPIELVAPGPGGTLPFDAGRFDSVVSTWTLCSIDELDAAIAEMHRVLKPGGRYYFLEHGRSRSTATSRWQDRINPLWHLISECSINLPIDAVVTRGGFELESLDEFLGKGPPVVSSLYRGTAVKA